MVSHLIWTDTQTNPTYGLIIQQQQQTKKTSSHITSSYFKMNSHRLQNRMIYRECIKYGEWNTFELEATI